MNDQQQAMAFDLGCVSFTAESKVFKTQLDQWHQFGVIQPWLEDEQGALHYVATSRNSALTRHLSKDVPCYFSTRINRLEKSNGLWKLTYFKSNNDNSGKDHSIFAKNIVIATPSAQAYDLLKEIPSLENEIKNHINNVPLSPQWVLAVELANDISQLSDLSFPESDVIHSISIESNKPSREHPRDTHILQIQATSQWSSDHIESEKQIIEFKMIKALESLLKQPINSINLHVHRWLYSTVDNKISHIDNYYACKSGLSIIGDYFNDGYFGTEASWFSAVALAKHLTEIKQIQQSNRANSNA